MIQGVISFGWLKAGRSSMAYDGYYGNNKRYGGDRKWACQFCELGGNFQSRTECRGCGKHWRTGAKRSNGPMPKDQEELIARVTQKVAAEVAKVAAACGAKGAEPKPEAVEVVDEPQEVEQKGKKAGEGDKRDMLDRKIRALEGSIALLKKEELDSADAEAELQRLRDERRSEANAAKDPWQQRQSLVHRQKKLEKQKAAADTKIAEARARLAQAQKDIDESTQEVAKVDKELAQVKIDIHQASAKAEETARDQAGAASAFGLPPEVEALPECAKASQGYIDMAAQYKAMHDYLQKCAIEFKAAGTEAKLPAAPLVPVEDMDDDEADNKVDVILAQAGVDVKSLGVEQRRNCGSELQRVTKRVRKTLSKCG